MAIKLFTIGDSISQGFMSGAAAKTDHSYSTLLAKILGATDYNFPVWEKGDLALDLETVFQKLERKLDTNISTFEWLNTILIINKYLDEVEDYYERGPGNLKRSIGPLPYHNVSVRGFDISNSWQVKPSDCEQLIDKSDKSGDNKFGIVNESLHRTAYKVLASGNPSSYFSQLDWLQHHHQKERN